MAQLNTATLAALNVDFDRRFIEAYNDPETVIWHPRLTTKVPSKTKQTTYALVDKVPGLREWLGPRVAHNLAAHDYTIVNKDFEGTVELDRNDVEDDNLGMFTGVALPGLAKAAKRHPDILLKSLLQNTTALAYDGVTFFNDAHPDYNGGTYDNLFATTALTSANLSTVWAAMAGYTGSDGQILGVTPDLLIVPPQLYRTALEILNATTVVSGGAAIDNVMRGWMDVLMIPELANQPTTWYLAVTKGPLKPFIFQERKAPEFVTRDRADDPRVFEQRKLLYGVDYRGNVGYTLPFLMAKASA